MEVKIKKRFYKICKFSVYLYVYGYKMIRQLARVLKFSYTFTPYLSITLYR